MHQSRPTPSRRAPSPLESETGQAAVLFTDPFPGVLLILALGFLCYLNTITVPFIFDDTPYLADNPIIRSFRYFLDPEAVLKLPVDYDVKNNFILRPVAYLTFAVNYALHGYDVRGYHVLNLLLHLGNALLVYALSFQTLAAATDGPDHQTASGRFLPLTVALLFVAHPLQTQAVTYIVQRFTTLSTFFFLAALSSYLVSRTATTPLTRRAAYLASLAAAVAAMNSKENAFTLPLVIAIYEGLFFSGALKTRLARLLPLVATMGIVPAKLVWLAVRQKQATGVDLNAAANLANFTGMQPADYLLTQFGVLVTYLRLLLLPSGQNLIHQVPVQRDFLALPVILPLAVLLAILALGIVLLCRAPRAAAADARLMRLVACGIFWFFVTNAVESSIIPLDDVIFEHRAYLPSFGFFLASVAGSSLLLSRCLPSIANRASLVGALACLLILAAAYATVQRNRVWQNRVTFWRDVVQKSPASSRAHNGLGVALATEGDLRLGDFIETDADNPAAKQVLDTALRHSSVKQLSMAAAIREFRTAVALKPDNEKANLNLGVALIQAGQHDAAILALDQAAANGMQASPLRYFHLGRAYGAKGATAAAIKAYQAAIAANPALPAPYQYLGDIYLREERSPEALAMYTAAYRLAPSRELLDRIVFLKRRQR